MFFYSTEVADNWRVHKNNDAFKYDFASSALITTDHQFSTTVGMRPATRKQLQKLVLRIFQANRITSYNT